MHSHQLNRASYALKLTCYISGGLASLLPIIEHNHHLHLATFSHQTFDFSIVLLTACLCMAFIAEKNWGGGLFYVSTYSSGHGIFLYHILFLTGAIGCLSAALPVVQSGSWALQTYTALLIIACLAWTTVVGMDISTEISKSKSMM